MIEQIKFDDRTYWDKLCGAEDNELIEKHKRLREDYVDSLRIYKDIYGYALQLLRNVLGIAEGKEEEELKLPVDIMMVADRCGFTVYPDEQMTQETYPPPASPWKDGPIAQILMRERMYGTKAGKIAGVIRIANNLSDNSMRFCVAHELGHFALRTVSPIGIMQIREACPGMYALVQQDEFLADLFAYALLIPYPAFIRLRKKYESDVTHWPINFSDWIAYLQNEAKIPEYHAVLAHQALKKLQCYNAVRPEKQAAKDNASESLLSESQPPEKNAISEEAAAEEVVSEQELQG